MWTSCASFGRVHHQLADQTLYERNVVGEILDDAGTKVMWRSLSCFGFDSPLYPGSGRPAPREPSRWQLTLLIRLCNCSRYGPPAVGAHDAA
jgi:hypothetical protein